MRRKIIKQGNNSYTLTLPINWIREEGIKEGTEIEVEEEDGHLIVKLPKGFRKEEESINIDVHNYNERTIRNILNQNYRKGYDKIIIQNVTEMQLENIRDIVRNTLLGFEVVEENSDNCIVQNIAEPSSEKFFIILRKIFLYILDESKEILNDFERNKLSSLRKRQYNKNIVDNYTNLCRRLIIKGRIGGNKNSYLLMMIVSRLSLIYHAYFYMYKFASEQKELRISNSTFQLLKEANNIFKLFYESFYEKDFDKAHEVGILKDKHLFGTLYDLLKKSKGAENILLYHIGEVVRLTHVESTNIFGLNDFELK